MNLDEASVPTAPVNTGEAFQGERIVDVYIARFSNWGRWGSEDELGALNHVGPAQVASAAQLVRQARSPSAASNK
jgi:hypothetical protein